MATGLGQQLGQMHLESNRSSNADGAPGQIIQLPAVGAPIAVYQRALQDMQGRYSDLRQVHSAAQLHSRQLENQVAILQADSDSEPSASSPATTTLARYVGEMKMHAKRFTIMHQLFVPSDNSFFLQARPFADLAATDRFANRSNRDRATLEQIYTVFPEHLHDFIQGHSSFSATFRAAAKNMRSHFVKRTRDVAPKVFNLPAEYFEVNYDRSKVPELQALLSFDQGKKFSKFAPVLYPRDKNGQLRRSHPKMFLSPALPQILKAILFGAASLSRDGKYAKPSTLGVQWGITERGKITIGSISTSVVGAVFIISPDKEFGTKGAQSDIEYEKFSWQIVEILINMARTDPTRFKRVMDHFNNGVFCGGQSSASADDSGSSEMEYGAESSDSDTEFSTSHQGPEAGRPIPSETNPHPSESIALVQPASTPQTRSPSDAVRPNIAEPQLAAPPQPFIEPFINSASRNEAVYQTPAVVEPRVVRMTSISATQHMSARVMIPAEQPGPAVQASILAGRHSLSRHMPAPAPFLPPATLSDDPDFESDLSQQWDTADTPPPSPPPAPKAKPKGKSKQPALRQADAMIIGAIAPESSAAAPRRKTRATTRRV